MEFPSPPRNNIVRVVPEGTEIPMCLCGDPCSFRESFDNSYTYGRRYWSCRNYDSDPTLHMRPRPLCEFIQYYDMEQTPEMERMRAWEYSHRRAMLEEQWREQEQEEKRKKEQEEMRAKRDAERQRHAAEQEAERQRKRERAARARAAGSEALRKGKYPRCTQ